MNLLSDARPHEWRRLTFQDESDWQQGIDLLENRIRGRYLHQIEQIEQEKHSGFAIIALDCLLIEMLQQFREGVIRTPAGEAGEYFSRFLTETSFGEFFTPQVAEMFYRQIRCGILHQAEVRGSSALRIGDEFPLVSFSQDHHGLLVNRILFHRQVEREFENFIAQLRNPANRDMRSKFRLKMDYICRHCGAAD